MPNPPALTTFGPEIMAALIEGSRNEVVVELSWNEAVVMRKRMHSLRARMRLDNHPLKDIVSAAKVTIRWGPEVPTSCSRKNVHYPTNGESLVELVIRPQDSTFRAALEKAGIKINTPEPLEAIASVETADDILTEFLKASPQK